MHPTEHRMARRADSPSDEGFAELVRRDRRSRDILFLVGVLRVGGCAAMAGVLASAPLHHADGQPAPRSRDLRRWCRGYPGRSVDLERGVDEMTVHKMLQAPERDVLL